MPLRKMTKTEVLSLPEGRELGPYHVKLSRLWEPEPKIMYEGLSDLYVQRAPAHKKLPERLACITTQNYTWAEGGAEDVEEDGSIVVEDYEMEIFVEEAT